MFKRIIARIKRYIRTLLGCYYIKLKAVLIEESNMGLLYRVFLPEATAPDVVVRELEVSLDGVSSVLQLSPGDPFVDLQPISDGVVVSVRARDTDDAGNVSDWGEALTFTARDTIVPTPPGAPATKLLGEVEDSIPAPDPAPSIPAEDPEPPPEEL
jgi:hypothetical protein